VADKKQILNTTAKALNFKLNDKKLGRMNVQLVPGINNVDSSLHKALKSLKGCKDMVEEGMLDFSPTLPKKSKVPEQDTTGRSVADPQKPLGKDSSEDDGFDD